MTLNNPSIIASFVLYIGRTALGIRQSSHVINFGVSKIYDHDMPVCFNDSIISRLYFKLHNSPFPTLSFFLEREYTVKLRLFVASSSAIKISAIDKFSWAFPLMVRSDGRCKNNFRIHRIYTQPDNCIMSFFFTTLPFIIYAKIGQILYRR